MAPIGIAKPLKIKGPHPASYREKAAKPRARTMRRATARATKATPALPVSRTGNSVRSVSEATPVGLRTRRRRQGPAKKQNAKTDQKMLQTLNSSIAVPSAFGWGIQRAFRRKCPKHRFGANHDLFLRGSGIAVGVQGGDKISPNIWSSAHRKVMVGAMWKNLQQVALHHSATELSAMQSVKHAQYTRRAV